MSNLTSPYNLTDVYRYSANNNWPFNCIATISPSVGGSNTINFFKGPLILSTNGTWTLVPTQTFYLRAKIWGAGGGPYQASFSTSPYIGGGGGGCVEGNIRFVANTTYTLIVGSNGALSSGGTSPPSPIGAGYWGGGGGAGSGIHDGVTHIMIAGGGGGGSGGFLCGAGGGLSGQDGAGSGGGLGGTQIYGGLKGFGSRSVNGSNGSGFFANTLGGFGGAGSGTPQSVALGGIGYGRGGDGAYAGGDFGGAGGGGGYTGGGGGAHLGGDFTGGGGGSGYAHPTKTSEVIYYTGNYTIPGNNNDPIRANSGDPGQPGKIYLSLIL